MKNLSWTITFNDNKCSFTTPKLPNIKSVKEQNEQKQIEQFLKGWIRG